MAGLGFVSVYWHNQSKLTGLLLLESVSTSAYTLIFVGIMLIAYIVVACSLLGLLSDQEEFIKYAKMLIVLAALMCGLSWGLVNQGEPYDPEVVQKHCE